jgi:hypothetical protein
MKVTIEFPEHTACATVSFVYVEDGGYMMCCANIDTNDFKKGYIKVPRSERDE